MKINERYEIKVVVYEWNNNISGDCYDNFALFKKNHPKSGYHFGFIVFDSYKGYIAADCNDWNESIEEALSDYENNCSDKPKNSDFLMCKKCNYFEQNGCVNSESIIMGNCMISNELKNELNGCCLKSLMN